MPNCIHSWYLLWHVEPEPYSLGNIFHWQPVLRTNTIPSSTFLYGIMGRPIVFSGFSSGKIFLISFHKSSGILVIVLTYFLLFSISIYDRKQTSYIPIYFWDRLLVKQSKNTFS
jgi:hypothetical protein